MPANISTPAHKINAPRLGYIGALDGLRALAVLAVLFYHADVVWLPGGFLGVEIFFVVSGYLITSLLLAEYRQHSSINFKQFWLRRARRLLPALFVMLIGVMAFEVIFLPDEVASLRGAVAAAFTYVTNWYLIFQQSSYFETIGRPSLLQHLWSLAVEEQFYLVWPLVFAFLLTRLKTRGAMLILMIGAVASALWMGIQYQPDADPSRIYYGTDTRAAGLLIGAALAFVWMPRGDEIKSRVWRWALDLVGLAAFGGLIAAGLLMSEFDSFLYQGGMFVVGAATALVIAAVVTPQSPLFGTLLSFDVLRWVGQRSYSLYLWHWPVFMLTRPQLDTTLEGTPLLLVRFSITFVLAEISYRIIETPIRQGGLGKAWENWHNTHGARRWGLGIAILGALAIFATGAFLLSNAVINAQAPAEPDYVLALPDEGTAPVGQESASNAPVSVADRFVKNPVTVGTTESQDATSSDMTSVSLIVPVLPDPFPDRSIKLEPQIIQDSWVQLIRSTRQPLVNSIQANIDELRRDRIDNGPRVARIPPPCNAACQARAEFLQIKAGMIHPAMQPAHFVPRKIVSSPVTTATIKSSPAQSAGPRPPTPESVEVLAIGDSVMLGASNYLRRAVFAIDVDAKIGRQVSAALTILQERSDAHLLPPVVIVHLGNNGTFSAQQFDQMMAILRNVPHVIFLNNHVPRKWQESNNLALAQGVTRYPNAKLLDWNGTSASHPDWFWSDGIHLRPDGASVYTNLIAEVLAQTAE